MKITELIEKLNEILKGDGDLDVWIDTTNEYTFGEIKDVVGSLYTGRLSNDNPHAYIISDHAPQDWDS